MNSGQTSLILRISLLLGVGSFLIIALIAVLSSSAKNDAVIFTSSIKSYLANQSEIYVLDLGRNITVNLTRNKSDDLDPEWSPDGSKIAFDSNREGNYQIYVRDLNTGITSRLFQSSNNQRFPSWSPDNKYIAYLSRPTITSLGSHQMWNIHIFSIDNKNLIEIPNNWDETAEEKPIWSPTNQYLTFRVYADGRSVIYNFDMKTYTISNILSHEGQNWYPAWSPNGEYISFMSQQGMGNQIYISDIATRVVHLFSNTSYPNDSFSIWSPNGKYIAIVTNDTTVEIRNAINGQVLSASSQFPSRLFSLTWTHDNEHLLIPIGQGNSDFSSGIYLFDIITKKIQKISQIITGDKAVHLAPQ